MGQLQIVSQLNVSVTRWYPLQSVLCCALGGVVFAGLEVCMGNYSHITSSCRCQSFARTASKGRSLRSSFGFGACAHPQHGQDGALYSLAVGWA